MSNKGLEAVTVAVDATVAMDLGLLTDGLASLLAIGRSVTGGPDDVPGTTLVDMIGAE